MLYNFQTKVIKTLSDTHTPVDALAGPHKLDLDAAEDFEDRLKEDEEAMAAYDEGRGVP